MIKNVVVNDNNNTHEKTSYGNELIHVSSTGYYGKQRLYLYYDNNLFRNWYYIINSNNGEIPEGELNYQMYKVDRISNKTVSTTTWKIRSRRLDIDDNENKNDENHDETK